MAKLQWLSVSFVAIRQGVCIYSDTKYILWLTVTRQSSFIDIKSALFTDVKTLELELQEIFRIQRLTPILQNRNQPHPSNA